MLRVLHINDYKTGGGAEVIVSRLLDLQRERGHDSRLFTGDGISGHQRTVLNYIISPRVAASLGEVLRDFKPDIVHAHNLYHLLTPHSLDAVRRYKRRHRCGVVLTAHDHALLCPNPGFRSFSRDGWTLADPDRLDDLRYVLSRRWDHRGFAYSLLRLGHLWHQSMGTYRVVDRVIAPSSYLGELLRARGFPVEVVPHPAPPARPSGGNRSPVLPLRLVFAGRVEPEKGLAEFIAAVPDDGSVRLTVIGEGSDVGRCKTAATAAHPVGAIEFVGRLERREVIDRIAGAHAVVVPSLVPESAGLTALEALSVGTAVIASDLGAVAEVIRETGAGFAFPPGDERGARAVIDAAKRALEDGTLHGFEVSDYLAERSESAWADEIDSVYQAVAPELMLSNSDGT